jgi:glycosyltransferase involved in cell wall biosynthesis
MQLIIASQHLSEDEPFVESLKLYKYRNEVKLMAGIDENTLSEITAASYACINMAPLHNDVTSLLNAMQCGVPVMAGNLKIAIELLEDAALYADAATPENIAEKLMLLYKDETKRNDMIKKVLLQSSKYNSNEATSAFWEDILTTKQQA